MSSSVFIESAATAPLRSQTTADGGSKDGVIGNVSTADSNLVVVYGKKGTNFDQKGLEKIIEEKAISSISVIRITSPTPSMQEEENRAEELDESCSDEELDNHGARGSNSESNLEDDDKSSDVGTDSSGEGDNKRTGKDGSSDDGRGAEAVRGGMKLRKKLRNLNLKSQKSRRRRKRVRPEILGLTVEEFYPEEDANALIKDVLRKAGLPTLKQSEYDFQLYVIMNDHCYTPFTPADQMDRPQVYVKEVPKQMPTGRKAQPSQPQVGRRKIRMQGPQKGQNRPGEVVRPMGLARGHCLPKRPLQISKPDRVVDATSDIDNDDEDIDVSTDEDDEEGENSESNVSAETDNDRDSDLDFRVTNRKIGKRKLLKLKKLKRLSVAAKTQHQNPFRRRRPTQDDQETTIVVLTPTQRNPKCINYRPVSIDPVRSGGKKISTTPTASAPSVAAISTPPTAARSIIAKPTVPAAIVAQQPKMLSDAIAALPPIPKKLAQQPPPSAVVNTTPPAIGKAMPQKTLPISPGIRQGPIHQVGDVATTKARPAVQQRPNTPPPSQSVKEIIINKVMASPKGGFTDIGALLQAVQSSPLSGESRPPEAQNQISTHALTSTPTASQPDARSIALATSSRKGFTPLVIEAAEKNELPAQISIQTHQSRSELAAEHDKQLDLIDSIVMDELQQTGSRIEQAAAPVHSDIPKLVKMLESTEQALEANAAYMPSIAATEMVSVDDDNTAEAVVTTTATSETSDDIDIGSTPLLETADDEIPDDLLQHMVKLIEDHQSLREEVEKQVFAANNSEITSVLSATQPQTHPTPLPSVPAPIDTLAPIFAVSSIQQEAPVTATAPAPLIPAVVRAAPTPPKKSIIEMAISNVPEVSTRIAPDTMVVRKEPIQIMRGNGRVITLPPIEAPTTRAKRRAQAPASLSKTQSPNTDAAPTNVSLNESSSLDSSLLTSDASFAVAATNAAETAAATVNPFEQTPSPAVALRRRSAKDGGIVVSPRKTPKAKGRRSANTGGSKATDFTDASESQEDDDDPKRLWCICRQPHNNRFMICCDACEDWFHGTCVSITKAMGLVMEQNGVEWTCPMCLKKQEEKKQRKITDMLPTKKTTQPKQLPSVSVPATTPHDTPPASAAVETTVTVTATATAADSMKTTPTTAVEALPKRPPPPTVVVSPQVKKTATPIVTSAQRKFFASTSIPLTPPTVQQTSSPTSTAVKRGSVSQSTPPLKSTTAAPARSVTSSGGKPPTNRTPNTIAAAATTPPPECIVCRKAARAASIYCSDECIRRHAQNALNASGDQSTSIVGSTHPSPTKSTADDVRKKKAKGLFEDLLAMPDRKLKAERVNVFERRTGRVLTGNSAPTTHNLRKWIQDNPTFEVVQPGSQLALEIENKQKQRAAQSSSSSSASVGRIQATMLTPVAAASASGTSVTGASLRPVKLLVDQVGKQPSSSRPATAQQLAKHPQPLTIRPDRVSKSFEYPAPKDDVRERSVREKALKRQSSDAATATTPAAATSSSSGGGKRHSDVDTEASVRLNVRRTLRDLIMQRLEATEAEGAPKLTAVDVEAFVRKTEAEMYEVFNRETNAKYKAKYRSLIFNIKDPKNKTLFAKICARTVEPRQLVRMSPEELASQELAQWREKEAKHQLEMIKKSELDLLSCAKNYVLKTHKGEEVIEDKTTDCFSLDMAIPVEDVVSALNKSGGGDVEHSPRGRESSSLHPEPDQQQTAQQHHHHHQHHEKPEKEDNKSKSSSKEREKDRDKDRDRGRVKERSHDRDRRHRSRDHHHEKARHKRSRSRSHSRSRSREKRHKSSHKEERRDKERTRDKDRERERDRDRDRHRDHHREEPQKKTQERRSLPAAASAAKPTASSSRERATASVGKTKPKSIPTFSLVDKILKSTKTVEEAANVAGKMQREPEKDKSQLAAAAPQNPVQSAAHVDGGRDDDRELTCTPSPSPDAYVRYTLASPNPLPTIWSGTINMIDVASFQIALQPVVGTLHNTGRFLPEELDVVGRIGPETVWDYISKIKKSPNKEIAVVRLVPATKTETAAYTILYQYLQKRKRLGVIKTSSPQIKDFYIFPLGARQERPSILRTPERVDFYEDVSRPDMLVGILILVTGRRSSTTPTQQQPAVSIAAASAVALKFPRRVNEDVSSFTPPGSPKRRRRSHATARKNEDIDVDAIIKAPIASKMQKSGAVFVHTSAPATAAIDDADEPYSPGGGSSDDDITPMVSSTTVDPQQSEEENLKRKMAYLNRQIAAQKKEIAGLLSADQRYAPSSSQTSTVLANISLPENLPQILASIKTPSAATSSTAPHIGTLLRKAKLANTKADDDEYNPEDAIASMPPPAMPKSYEATVKMPEKSSTSRLARLSEAELLSMVPDELMQQPPPKSTHTAEPPPPGV